MEKKNYSSLEYKLIRVIIMLEMNFMCYICQTKKISNELHHVNKNSNDNSINNLVVLCRKCHLITHKNNLNLVYKIENEIVLKLENIRKEINLLIKNSK